MKKLLLASMPIMGIALLSACKTNSISLDSKEATSFSLASAVRMMNEDQTKVQALAQTENYDYLIDYVEMAESLLLENGGFKSETLESDKESYKTLIKISYTSLNKDKEEIKLYYNEELKKTKVDEDEIEERYTLSGVAYLNDIEYILSGYRKIETEHNEEEKSSEYTIKKDNLTYITVKEEYETEDDEKEQFFSYKVVSNGVSTKHFSLNIEEERNEKSIHIKDSLDALKKEYKFEIEKKNDVEYIKIYSKEGSTSTIIMCRRVLNETSNKYEYEFKKS